MASVIRQQIKVTGIVQGVGFRPWVYRLATQLQLSGSVLNNAAGVTIELQGERNTLAQFCQLLHTTPPPLAQIDAISVTSLACQDDQEEFVILDSQDDCAISVSVSPDKSCCEDCLTEMGDPHSRFYQYPFTNCTNCGPRYTIIRALPYDRPNTAMADFAMCPDCAREYHDPCNRRYHAQPVSCPHCGPQLTLLDNQGQVLAKRNDALEQTIAAILAGQIVAVKGLGGFHLICDATNQTAVAALRQRKHRPAKPLAVMAADIEMAQHLVRGNDAEWQQLTSRERPIVLMQLAAKQQSFGQKQSAPKKASTAQYVDIALCDAIAPGLERLGIFLPYTPLHHLMLSRLKRPIVATSANISGEPIISDANTILSKLGNVVDLVLDHNRPIIHPCDDSVVQVIDGELQIMRLARGYAPLTLALSQSTDAPAATSTTGHSILAVGPQQKNTLALATAGKMLLSPHIGDLFSLAAGHYFQQSREALEHLYQTQPKMLVHDLHPDYLSSRWAIETAKADPAIRLLSLQHHYAHVLAVMAANQYRGEVLGFCFDGTGLGDDNTLWGGEMLRCDLQGFQRLAHWRPVSLIGMEQAVKQPWRVLLALLFDHYSPTQIMALNLPVLTHVSATMMNNIHTLWRKQQRCIASSSTGRLFDAAAALLGLLGDTGFEGEAGMKLEQLASAYLADHPQHQHPADADCCFTLVAVGQHPQQWDSHGLFAQMLSAVQAAPLTQNRQQQIALGFIQALAKLVIGQARAHPALPVVLCGGVFQNRLLLSLCRQGLQQAGHSVLSSGQVPVNDAGIALGQLWYGLHH
ncbi:carbamoyltransferase HypF [Shewanella sp. NFH-SH190041]|uniref:carbamoyltransferase HypF n=1 Tax=Shewanella sp. NFH-SH190041 TaxID=2950245 RepID=UPI0021C2C611|nr:carbamoyltransferase HypF [Shewanella sp. NFH-SH190041]BDM64084.1 carbamoyltransferase HypF [Shewanella sp. NFH-SH190041]